MGEKVNLHICIEEESINKLNSLYKLVGCKTKSQFIEQAINFYSGYELSKEMSTYISTAITESINRPIQSFENRISKILFKYAVEQALLMNVIAAFYNVDKKQINVIRGQCVEAIKQTRGKFDFNDAVEWQKGESDV